MTKEDYILRALGKVTVSFSSLEIRIAEHIRKFITNDYELARCITARLSFVDLLTLLSTLFKYRISDEVMLEKFATLTTTLNKLNEERNNLIHSEWFILREYAIREKASKDIKKGLEVQTKKYELSDIRF